MCAKARNIVAVKRTMGKVAGTLVSLASRLSLQRLAAYLPGLVCPYRQVGLCPLTADYIDLCVDALPKQAPGPFSPRDLLQSQPRLITSFFSRSFPKTKTGHRIQRSLVAGCTTGSLYPRCPSLRGEVLSLYSARVLSAFNDKGVGSRCISQTAYSSCI